MNASCMRVLGASAITQTPQRQAEDGARVTVVEILEGALVALGDSLNQFTVIHQVDRIHRSQRSRCHNQ